MMDANFKLRSKDRSVQDVALSPGWAYYVQQEAFAKHVEAFGKGKEDVRVSLFLSNLLFSNMFIEKYLFC